MDRIPIESVILVTTDSNLTNQKAKKSILMEGDKQ